MEFDVMREKEMEKPAWVERCNESESVKIETKNSELVFGLNSVKSRLKLFAAAASAAMHIVRSNRSRHFSNYSCIEPNFLVK